MRAPASASSSSRSASPAPRPRRPQPRPANNARSPSRPSSTKRAALGHRQRLRGRLAVHGRRRRRDLRLQRRRLPRPLSRRRRERPASFYRNASTRGGPLKFEAETNGLELDAVTGAYPLDVDGDGITDLVVLRVGENVVMRGLGDCRFERANEAWGFDGGDAWSTAFAATWEKGNRLADARRRQLHRPQRGNVALGLLHRQLAASVRRRRGGSSSRRRLPLKPSFCPLSMLFTDWNRSGTPSLRVSNDREYYEGGQEQMWRIEPGKPPALYTADEGWKLICASGAWASPATTSTATAIPTTS